MLTLQGLAGIFVSSVIDYGSVLWLQSFYFSCTGFILSVIIINQNPTEIPSMSHSGGYLTQKLKMAFGGHANVALLLESYHKKLSQYTPVYTTAELVNSKSAADRKGRRMLTTIKNSA